MNVFQQSAVGGNGLLNLLFRSFVHMDNLGASGIRMLQMKVFESDVAETAVRCPQREGIIASAFSGRKWNY